MFSVAYEIIKGEVVFLLSFANILYTVTCPPPTQWKVCIISTELKEQTERGNKLIRSEGPKKEITRNGKSLNTKKKKRFLRSASFFSNFTFKGRKRNLSQYVVVINVDFGSRHV